MRQKLEINGVWSFQVDRKDEGERNRWYEQGLPSSMSVEVPHIWQTEEQYVNYCGTAWYGKEFQYTSLEENRSYVLYFGAVDFEARVWLNGSYIGSHEGGFTPFELDITDQLKAGSNHLVVRVFDPQDNAEIPIGKQGSWYTRVSGIWQEVYIEARALTSVKSVHIVSSIDTMSIAAAIKLQGNVTDTDSYMIEYIITEHEKGEQVVQSLKVALSGSEATHSISLPDAKLWSPHQPQLYDMQVTLRANDEIIDQYSSYFGMREVKFEGGHILLNNKPLFVRAALDQAFYPDTIFSAPSDEWIINEINLAKQMGFNLLRKHIKVEIPRYLYWADRMGMLIWAEPPNVIKWSAQSRSRFYNELVAMIDRDYNRPSILIWSLYNEEWGLEWDLRNDVHKQEHVKQMYDDIKKLDPTRLICDNSGWIHVKTDINDHHRYFTLPEQIEDWKADLDDYVIANPDDNYVKGYGSQGQPIIISEFGVWGLPSVEKIMEFYESQPSWFANLGDDTHREDFKMPLNAFDKFDKYQLDRIFNDFENLALYTQERMHRAVKSIIEEMRKREAINGYVVTEFTDIEWETNGWLDYTRNLKAGFQHAADFNGALVVMIDKESRNMWSGEEQSWDIVISNHDLQRLNGTVEWEIVGTDIQGIASLNDNAQATITLQSAISFTAPAIEKAGHYQLQIRIVDQRQVLAKNEYELTISPRQAAAGGSVYPYALSSDFIMKLVANGYTIVHAVEDADAVITSTLDTEIMDYYRNGGHVVFLAEEGDGLADKDMFTFRQLIQGESWDRASSFNFVDPAHFPEVPLHHMMGWEMEGLYPDYIVPFSNYNKLGGTIGRVVYMFGNEGITEKSEIISGYFQGWLGQAGGSLLVQRSEKGSLTLTTWKLKEQYGVHPIATGIIHSLLAKCMQQ